MPRSAPPTGLTVSRSGGNFTAKWKFGDPNYDSGQNFQYKYNDGTWAGKPVSTKQTSLTLGLNVASFYPSGGKLTKLPVRVRGKRAPFAKITPDWSAWVNYTFNILPPNVPAITATIGTWPRCAFAWKTTVSQTDNKWFRDVQYQSVLVKDSTITDGSKINWSATDVGQRYAATGQPANGTLTITEDSSQLNDGHSYTRWFRCRSRGPGGDSAWRYSKHVYALPLQPTITSYEVTPNTSANGYTAQVWFDNPYNAARPISTIVTQYAIATPDAGMQCPAGASWKDAVTGTVKDATGGAAFAIDTLLASDQCLFVRVNATYDDRTTYGTPVMVDAGFLSNPSGLSVQTNQEQHTATITATNNSNVPDSFLVVRFYSNDTPDGFDIGIIAHGESSTIVQCPTWSASGQIMFGVRAAVGTYTETTGSDGVSSYAVTSTMESALIIKTGGAVPVAPENVAAFPTSTTGTIRVTWDWSWAAADSAEISWADHPDAWESTDEPDAYRITKMHASAWNISSLATGVTWYIRVRLISGSGETATYGAYSQMVKVDLSSAPTAPVVALSDSVITETGSVTASWAYATTDGTAQAFAEIAECVTTAGVTTYETIAQVETAQQYTISADAAGWNSGETHLIAVRVMSASGRLSDEWSAPVAVLVAEPLTCEITQTSLDDVTIEVEVEEEPVSVTFTALTEMPLTITVEGAGEEGTTTVIIERAAAYHVDRPDETDYNGFEGEVVASITQTGEAQMTITLDDLIGPLDDTAQYRIIATVQDGLGQSAQAMEDFEVYWSHQAIAPEATVEIDRDEMIAILTPIAPEGAAETDVCDIYRLSVDKPELVYRGAEFGVQYVDPYPTLGEYGGHRFVLRTENGDYITADDHLAWTDTTGEDGDILESNYNIIEFETGRVELEYNVDLSSDWAKDFRETQYLGGSIQGDWNQAVKRTGTISTVGITSTDQTLIENMRRLAAFPGICHVRTKDGSSYAADVQVSESLPQSTAHKVASFTLKITKIDQEELDGMTYDEWRQGELG